VKEMNVDEEFSVNEGDEERVWERR